MTSNVANATEPKLARRPNVIPNGHTTYGRNALLNIRSTSMIKLKRPLHEEMFRLAIWGQHHGCSLTSCSSCEVSPRKSIPIHLTAPSHRVSCGEGHVNFANLSEVKLNPGLPPTTIMVPVPGEPVRAEPGTGISGAVLSQQSDIPLVMDAFKRCPRARSKANCASLTKFKVTPRPHQSQTKTILCALLNVCSIGDTEKAECIKDFITSNELDLLCLTETWLLGDQSDIQRIAEITPVGYAFHHCPRRGQHSGGVGVLVHKPLVAKINKPSKYVSFEHIDLEVTIAKSHLRLVTIYRPPPSSKNKATPSAFFEEFSTLLEILAIYPGNLIVTGDFNFHVDVPSNPQAR